MMTNMLRALMKNMDNLQEKMGNVSKRDYTPSHVLLHM